MLNYCGGTERLLQFTEALFKKSIHFDRASFLRYASFAAIECNSEFTTSESDFREVPNFEQATFVQAPRLDGIIRPTRSLSDRCKEFFRGDRALEGYWRALRRLAAQGHDQTSEKLFWTKELLARRGVTDRYWHASFWLGLVYQLFSNFGRSMVLPLGWWVLAFVGFSWLYRLWHPAEGASGDPGCVNLATTPWTAALGLSLHNSFPAVLASGEKVLEWHACLFGYHTESPNRPVFPDGVSFLSAAQRLFSTMMIFLMLLAIRNHFRVR